MSRGGNAWIAHVAVALAYALGYTAFREISFSHWVLFAGFRLCVLLLLPYRFWPAVAVGELLPLTYFSSRWAPTLGWAWFGAMLLPPILIAMPVVRWARDRLKIFNGAHVNINALLACSFVTAMAWDALNLLTASFMHTQPGAHSPTWAFMAGQYFLGMYLGILTLVPVVLMVRELLRSNTRDQIWTRIAESRLLLESISLLLPALALLTWIASHGRGDGSEAARIAMFLPVAWLALRHGWHGAAIGGTAASVAVVLTMPAIHDYGTLQAQVFIAFTITTMLLLGGRIGALDQKESLGRDETRLVLAMAQRNVYLGEMQLRQAAFALEQIGTTVQATYGQLLGRLRHLLPATDERTYFRQAALAQHQMYRLADRLYPITWRDRGLPAALREGAIPRALDEAGIGYWCEIGGRGLSQLSVTLHITLYRLACDAVLLACEGRDVKSIRLRLRGGETGSRRWAVLCVDCEKGRDAALPLQWDDLLPLMGGSGMGLGGIRDRAAIFEGRVHSRQAPGGQRLSVMLFDPEALD